MRLETSFWPNCMSGSRELGSWPAQVPEFGSLRLFSSISLSFFFFSNSSIPSMVSRMSLTKIHLIYSVSESIAAMTPIRNTISIHRGPVPEPFQLPTLQVAVVGLFLSWERTQWQMQICFIVSSGWIKACKKVNFRFWVGNKFTRFWIGIFCTIFSTFN